MVTMSSIDCMGEYIKLVCPNKSMQPSMQISRNTTARLVTLATVFADLCIFDDND